MRATNDTVNLVEEIKGKLSTTDKEEIFGMKKRGFATNNERPSTRKIVAEIKKKNKRKANA